MPTALERLTGQVTQADDGHPIEPTIVPQAYTVSVNGLVTGADGTTRLPQRGHSHAGCRLQDARRPRTGNVVTGCCRGLHRPERRGHRGGLVSDRGCPTTPAPLFDVIVPVAASGPVDVHLTLPVLRATVSGQVFAADGVTHRSTRRRLSAWLRADGYTMVGTTLQNGAYSFASRFLPLATRRGVVRCTWSGLPDGYLEAPSPAVEVNDEALVVNMTLPASSLFAHVSGTVVAQGDGQTPIDAPGSRCCVRTAPKSAAACRQDRPLRPVGALPADGRFRCVRIRPAARQSPSKTARRRPQGATVDVGSVLLP